MSFRVPCPNCGPRSAYEFRFGGEYRVPPGTTGTAGAETAETAESPPTPREWAHYLFARRNEAGVQKEWWFHRQGCGRWFVALRDTRTNTVLETAWP
jgi:sarcosine oxidase subunit delta